MVGVAAMADEVDEEEDDDSLPPPPPPPRRLLGWLIDEALRSYLFIEDEGWGRADGHVFLVVLGDSRHLSCLDFSETKTRRWRQSIIICPHCISQINE